MSEKKKVAIVTDSNSGISQKKAEKYGIYVLPMPFNVDGVEYLEGLDMNHNEFFERQVNGSTIFTSQPSPAAVLDLWDELLEEYEEIVHIPMAGTLSSSFGTATALSRDYDGKVIVVDNLRLSMGLKQAVLEAKEMADAGESANSIYQKLMFTKEDASIFIAIEDLKYLKAGGRISGATAAMGSVLNIKPVLSFVNGVIGPAGKARGKKGAMKMIVELTKKEMEQKFHDTDINNYILYTAACLRKDEAIEWNQYIMEQFGVFSQIETIPLSIATHVGVGAFAICICKKH